MVYFEEYAITYYLMLIIYVTELIQYQRITQSHRVCVNAQTQNNRF